MTSEQIDWRSNNWETANIGLYGSVVELRHVNPDVVGSNPAGVNLSLFHPKSVNAMMN